MSRTTCENRFIFVAAICTGLMVTSARGGTLDAPAGPESTASAMWTLNDIYNVLNTRTTNVAKRAGEFAEPTGGPTNGTMRTLNDIMTLVTNRAPVAKTGQTNTYAVGDDGWYSTNVGVAWPTQRFTAVATSGDATNQIRDNLTGLIWARNANLATNTTWAATWSSVDGQCSWTQAFDVITNDLGPVNGARYGGTNDWRLPNWNELYSLIDVGRSNPALCNTAGTGKLGENDPFTGVLSTNYWTSTLYLASPAAVEDVNMFWGLLDALTRLPTVSNACVWPVRGGR